MNRWRTWLSYGLAVTGVATGGLLSFWFVPITVWVRCAPALFVVLSVFAAAILVRLARPSPFSNPDVFTDENVDRYFDALIQVGRRLAVVFFADIAVIVMLVYAIARFPGELPQLSDSFIHIYEPLLISGLNGGLCAFLSIRIVSIVLGDIGFIKLQRSIVADFRRRKSLSSASVIVGKPTAWKSAGGYG